MSWAVEWNARFRVRRGRRGAVPAVAFVMAAGAVLAIARGLPETDGGAPFVRDLWPRTPYFIGPFQAVLLRVSPWCRGLCALLLWRGWRMGVPVALAWTGVEVLGAVLLFRDRIRLLWGYDPTVPAVWDGSLSGPALLAVQAVLWLGCAWVLGRHLRLHGTKVAPAAPEPAERGSPTAS